MKVLAAICVMLTVVVAGFLFAPVFGVTALLLPVAVPAVVLLAVDLLVARLAVWRPLLLAVAGLLAVIETTLPATTVAGLPTAETLAALGSGLTDSWQAALQSTWPARPDAAVLLFVPLLVVLAGVLGLELLHRLDNPLPALAPGFVVVILSQFYVSLTGWTAAALALVYATAAGALLAVTRENSGLRLSNAVPVAVAVVCAVGAGALLPAPAARYSLKEDQSAPMASLTVSNPLDEISFRLSHPAAPVFEVHGDAGVDRWPLVVLDRFDGVNWTPGDQYLRLGTELRPGPAVTVGLRTRSARVDLIDIDGPWLPSQTWPAAVTGAEPWVEQQQGTLRRKGSENSYTLQWWEPQIDATALFGAAVDPDAPGGLGSVGTVPDGVSELAGQAVQGMRPSLLSALVLERFFRDKYQLETGPNLPTGHSWPHLTEFLLTSKRGTSEQFAAAYVALARVLSIPARLVVGYRAPRGQDQVVRNGDVYAWPEVAVKGVGWVRLDPAEQDAAPSSGAGTGLGAAAAGARAQLPAPQDLRQQPVAESPDGDDPGPGGTAIPWAWVLGVPLGLVTLLVLGIPVIKTIRAWRRRRRAGAGAVVGAWEEARDRLRAHGLPVTAGMTVRDLVSAAAGISSDERTRAGLHQLSVTVDVALWSGVSLGAHSGQQAWDAVRDVRRGLARRGWRARIRAAFEPRTLRSPRG
ncbi:MAG: transglutaminaseTgpA domain-containing protein [Kibdelosporangium sp.]